MFLFILELETLAIVSHFFIGSVNLYLKCTDNSQEWRLIQLIGVSMRI